MPSLSEELASLTSTAPSIDPELIGWDDAANIAPGAKQVPIPPPEQATPTWAPEQGVWGLQVLLQVFKGHCSDRVWCCLIRVLTHVASGTLI